MQTLQCLLFFVNKFGHYEFTVLQIMSLTKQFSIQILVIMIKFHYKNVRMQNIQKMDEPKVS